MTRQHDSPEAARGAALLLFALEYVFDVYMSPGSVTEQLHFYAAPYAADATSGAGGGLADEGEDIEVIELPSPWPST